ncbi:MAG: alpha/beta hydrolase [Micavibrio sp.]
MDQQGFLVNELGGSRRGVRPLPVFLTLAGMTSADSAQHLAMVEGLKLYLSHPFKRAEEQRNVIWQSGEVTLRHLPAGGKHHLLLVPSMINRSVILDLLPERSFAHWLVAQGIDVYILDWGNPVNDPDQASVDDVLLKKLLPCLSFINEKTGSYQALGYCMGGTLLAGAAHFQPAGLEKIIYLASPWDFHAGDCRLQNQIMMGTPSALQMTENGKGLPSNWIQSVFATVNAEKNIHKFVDFKNIEQDSDQARLFVALEDWLNDGVDLPAAIARTCIVEWYGENRPCHKKWIVEDQVIDPARLDIPALVVASATDRLVPCEGSHALARILPKVTTLETDCGHIGMMTSRRAVENVWKPLLEWIAA